MLSLLGSGCASTPDVPICIEINPHKGWCTYTVSDKEFYVDEVNKLKTKRGLKSWWEIRPYVIKIPFDSWTKIKASFIKNCKLNKQCSKTIRSWEKKLDKLDNNGS